MPAAEVQRSAGKGFTKNELPVSLFSWNYQSAQPADEWFRMAHAYIASSDVLFGSIEAGKLLPTFHHAKVAAFLLEQSLEQFLKAALIVAGDQVSPIHALGLLYARFRKLYPGKAFSWTARIGEATVDSPAQPGNEFLRYPVDASGARWEGNVHFDLGVWQTQARAFRSDYQRLEPAIRRRYE